MTLNTYRGEIVNSPEAVEIPFGGAVMFVVNWPTEEIRCESVDAASMVPSLAKRLLREIPVWQPLSAGLKQLKTGFEMLEETKRLADPENMIRRIQNVGYAVKYLESDEEAADLVNDLTWMSKNGDEKQLGKPDVLAQFDNRVRRWQHTPATAAHFEPIETATKEQVLFGLEELRPAMDVVGSLSAAPSVASLTAAVETHLQKVDLHVTKFEQELRDSLEPHKLTFAGLGSYVENAGPLAGRVYFLLVPSVRQAFKRRSEELIRIIRNLNVPFADIIPLEALSETDAETFTSKLGTEIHATLWLSQNQYASLDQLAEIAPTLVGTHEHGNLHVTAGKGVFRGIEGVPVGPAAAGLRKRIDQSFDQNHGEHNGESSGCIQPFRLEPAGRKRLPWSSTGLWQPDAVRHLARNPASLAASGGEPLLAVLRLFDQEVSVRVHEHWGQTRRNVEVSRLDERSPFVVVPSTRNIGIEVCWRDSLLSQAGRLRQAVSTIAGNS